MMHNTEKYDKTDKTEECHKMSSGIINCPWAWSFPGEACQGGKRVQ